MDDGINGIKSLGETVLIIENYAKIQPHIQKEQPCQED
jgi:hypothetical protein